MSFLLRLVNSKPGIYLIYNYLLFTSRQSCSNSIEFNCILIERNPVNEVFIILVHLR